VPSPQSFAATPESGTSAPVAIWPHGVIAAPVSDTADLSAPAPENFRYIPVWQQQPVMHSGRASVMRKSKAAAARRSSAGKTAARKDPVRPAAATPIGHQILQLPKPAAEAPPPAKKRAAALGLTR
jgi:hypothetical protein